MLPRYENLDSIEIQHVQDLIDAQVPEDVRLEYKSDGYANGAETREWCKDISAMANTEGGCIVLGMREENGVASELIGIEGDIDVILRRLLQSAEANIRHRIQIKHKRFALSNGRNVVLLATRKSRYGPHMSVAQQDWRIHKRSGVHIERMDIDELRRSFLFSRAAEEIALETHQSHCKGLERTEDSYTAILG